MLKMKFKRDFGCDTRKACPLRVKGDDPDPLKGELASFMLSLTTKKQ